MSPTRNPRCGAIGWFITGENTRTTPAISLYYVDCDTYFQLLFASQTCAYAWAINVFLTGLHENEGGCNTVCTGMLNLLLNKTCIPDTTYKCPYDPADCSLQECLQCNDRVSGAQFYELSGMTRRFAGIHTMLPRPCGELADINHTCVAKL